MIAKVETILDMEIRRLMKRFRKITGLQEGDPIYIKCKKDITFTLRMAEGKRIAKAKRSDNNTGLFGGIL